ncbi:amidohydrolase [Nocardioides cavernaquae]|uniref:Amidohydrolase n=1 Tax=Nocardioides cavernaquae TaxID=2321396 RepID=A0A3A5HBP7_9ACTN|nr:amidohydrolase [Nocardioides cavernaquae]
MARLGVPGLFDVHTHFHPPRVFEKVRAAFDQAGPFIGRAWPIRYRSDEEELVATLRSFGVRRFPALTYAHKPDMAEFLNDWCTGFAARTPGSLLSATFYPEPSAEEYVARRLAAGTEIFKVHVQVGAFSVLDPLLDRVWAQVAEAGTPVVLHAGSGPMPGAHTGPAPVEELLGRHPRLCLVIAHAGAPESEEFLALAEQFERVHLDLTMVFTDFFEEAGRFPGVLLPRLAALQDKVLFGSDFPNIPYPYAHQVAVLERLELGDAWLRAVCWENGARMFGAG